MNHPPARAPARRARSRFSAVGLVIAGALLGGCASTPPPEPETAGILVASYDHEGAVGSGEVVVDFGAGQYGYPHANSSFLVSSRSAETGVGHQSPFYGLFGPHSFVSGHGLGYRAPVVVRYPPRTSSPGPRTTSPVAANPPPRSTVRTSSAPRVSRGSPAARRVESATRARTRSQPDHRRDTR